jgi:uracil-DNA glycosylase
MTTPRSLLRRYLRQLRVTGIHELRLETLTREQAIALAAAARTTWPAPRDSEPDCARPTAGIVVVGEGLGEDRTGRPFAGSAGGLLDLLLMTAGFTRDAVYICNVLQCRAPDDRDPLQDAAEVGAKMYLDPQVDAIVPRVTMAAGEFAAQSLLATDAPISQLRNTIHEYHGRPLIVTYDPALLLRSPHMCRVAWHDFQLLRRVYDEQQG